MNILERAGIDVGAAEFWQGGFDVLARNVEELEMIGDRGLGIGGRGSVIGDRWLVAGSAVGNRSTKGEWGEATWREGIGEQGIVSRLPHPYARLWDGGDGGCPRVNC